MNRFFIFLFLFLFSFLFNISFFSFSGFSVTKKNSEALYRSSPVVFIRYQKHVVLAKVEQNENNLKEWRVEIPSLTVVQKDQSRWIDSKFLETLDALSSPQLLEYLDENPCHPSNFSSQTQHSSESPSSTLPIRFESANVKGVLGLVIYIFTRQGAVRLLDHSVTQIPTDMKIPSYVKEVPDDFYQAMLNEQARKESGGGFLIEYRGKVKKLMVNNASLSSAESLKAFWADPLPESFLTRLNIRHDRSHFPEDLVFQETGDRQNFQARYVIRQPWRGNDSCAAAEDYRRSLASRYEQEAENLSQLTGWPIKNIQKVMKDSFPRKKKWYQYIWGDQD